MNDTHYAVLATALEQIVNSDDDSAYIDKKEKVLAACDKNTLEEFLSYFDDDD